MGNNNLNRAKKAKNDEFYTQLSDIEKELQHYKEHFKGKKIYLNADNYKESMFWKYFSLSFDHLGLESLTATHFSNSERVNKAVLTKDGLVIEELKQNGDFRSQESIDILKESDIVVSNTPFSLFREYIAQLMKYDKKFLVIGNMNAITYKETFGFIKENRLWLGISAPKIFTVPEHYEVTKNIFIDEDGIKKAKFGNILWFTNLEHKIRNEEVLLYKEYNEVDYPKYDNYDAINVDKVKDIPKDYYKEVGVPITFLSKYNPNQFEILGDSRYITGGDKANDINYINGKLLYRRIIMKRKDTNEVFM